MSTTTVEAGTSFPRDVFRFPCKCGGVFVKSSVTPAEMAKYNCSRPYACCAAAFECDKCETRLVGSHEAPEAW